LIPRFQIRDIDVVVNEPKFQCLEATRDDHAIIVQLSDGQPYRIPLTHHGASSFIDVRRPIKTEMSDSELLSVELTNSTPEWEH
jgi:hypothetical protein